jgi:NTP pyrophosphatase (non-canonical NTP hydrolase)
VAGRGGARTGVAVDDGPLTVDRLGAVWVMDWAALTTAVWGMAQDKGWHDDGPDGPRTFGDVIALIHSEATEALQDYRDGHGLDEVYYEGSKPCGVGIELADVLIRVLDACGCYGIDIGDCVARKIAYNATRPYRHGNKRL